MTRLLQVYRWMNWLSIDVVVGAMLGALYFGRVLNVVILPYGIAALGITVWVIYTTDHLRDARAIGKNASSLRHRFHQQHFLILTILVALAALIDLVLLFYIRRSVFIAGLLLTIPVALYLVFHARLYFLKELMVALLYTLGVLLPSLAVTDEIVSFGHVVLMLQFFILALLNLLIFSIYDHDKDVKDGLHSFVTKFGVKFTESVVVILLILFLASCITTFVDGTVTKYGLVLMPAAVVLLVIFNRPAFFSKDDRYRIIGDAIFYFPAMIFLYA